MLTIKKILFCKRSKTILQSLTKSCENISLLELGTVAYFLILLLSQIKKYPGFNLKNEDIYIYNIRNTCAFVHIRY